MCWGNVSTLVEVGKDHHCGWMSINTLCLQQRFLFETRPWFLTLTLNQELWGSRHDHKPVNSWWFSSYVQYCNLPNSYIKIQWCFCCKWINVAVQLISILRCHFNCYYIHHVYCCDGLYIEDVKVELFFAPQHMRSWARHLLELMSWQ